MMATTVSIIVRNELSKRNMIDKMINKINDKTGKNRLFFSG